MRDRIEIHKPTLTPNGSGGQSESPLSASTLVLSALASVTALKPTREQLAGQDRFGQSLKVTIWARPNLSLTTGMVLRYNGIRYALQGPPIAGGSGRQSWTLYATSSAL